MNGSKLDLLKSSSPKDNADGGKSGSMAIDADQASDAAVDRVHIDSKKVSHQLGAQMGTYPSKGMTKKMAAAANPASPKKRRNKNNSSVKKKDEKSQNMVAAAQNRCEMAKNYSTVSNEESSSSIQLDYDYVNLSMSNQTTNQLETKVLESENASSGGGTGSVVSGGSGPNGSNNSAIAKHRGIGAKVSKMKTFSLSLNVIMQLSGQPLPQQILEAMRLVRRMSPNEVGIFRKNGNKARINKLKELIDKNESINFQTSDLTIFDIADMIKLYFRELPECLITNKLSNILLSNYTSKIGILKMNILS